MNMHKYLVIMQYPDTVMVKGHDDLLAAERDFNSRCGMLRRYSGEVEVRHFGDQLGVVALADAPNNCTYIVRTH
jgi:hypothetical protein